MSIGKALANLRPKSSWIIRDGILEWLDKEQTQPPQTEIDAEVSRLKSIHDATQYQRDRLQEYPSLQECIHAILDDDLTALQAKRKLVKEKYPKPE
tara:strand:+ start:643 stop:930 length:288 start_codon:yes stop_codon:yes gene_type:complete